jgi:hypothetical protein
MVKKKKLAANFLLTLAVLAAPATVFADNSNVTDATNPIDKKEEQQSKEASTGTMTLTPVKVERTGDASTMSTTEKYMLTYDFTTTLTGPSRYFSGQNIRIRLNSYRTGCDHCLNTFEVSLYRGSTKIGTAGFPRSGSDTVEWTNVGPGNYYLYFKKAFDGERITNKDDTSFIESYN